VISGLVTAQCAPIAQRDPTLAAHVARMDNMLQGGAHIYVQKAFYLLRSRLGILKKIDFKTRNSPILCFYFNKNIQKLSTLVIFSLLVIFINFYFPQTGVTKKRLFCDVFSII
jgi:hypothetical protein